jgi:tRNA modification GTPase
VASAGLDDTIAAIATPPGAGALALLRVSGPRASEIAIALCPELRGTLPRPREQRFLRILHPQTGDPIDRGLVTWFPGPASYTGEDSLELSVHGGPVTAGLALGAVVAAGARLALPGEFTRRAVLNGKLDLLQAEAILDLVEGDSPALQRAAVHQMERGLSARIERLRTDLLRAEALISYGIDFPEEDEPPVSEGTIRMAVEGIFDAIEFLLSTVPQAVLLREGALVVLAGRPNAGKSSLFNALLGLERAIVTPIPGTTRDAIEATLTIEGYPFRLIDTAGLRQTGDTVESLGVEVAQRYIAAADVVLFCREIGGQDDREQDQMFLDSVSPANLVMVSPLTARLISLERFPSPLTRGWVSPNCVNGC